MTDIARLEASLREHEGVKDNLYICPANKLSIAVGRNIEDRPLTGQELRTLYDNKEITVTLTAAGIQRLLSADAKLHSDLCKLIIPGWHDIDDVRRTVLAEMCYQLGLTRLAGFKKMLQAVEDRDWARAATEGRNSKWHRKDSPKRAEKLMQILESGQWPA